MGKILILIAVIQIAVLCAAQQQLQTKGPNSEHAKLTYGSFPQPAPSTAQKAATSFGQPPTGAAIPPVAGAKPAAPAAAAVNPPPAGNPPPAVTTAPAAGPTTPKKPDIISDNELREISEELLSKDTNNAAKYLTVNLQKQILRNETTDQAPKPLLTVKPEAFKIPTIAKMQALFDNYVADVAVDEKITPAEIKEESDFLDAIIPTQVMQVVKNVLIKKGLIKTDADFKDALKRIWFTLYSRGQGHKMGSSGFEHVFLGETNKGQPAGLHNWINFSIEEAKGNVNYMGYLRNVDLKDKGSLVKLRFKLNGQVKSVTTMFLGSSPEFEIALYTLCFMTRAEHHCPVKMNGTKFTIRTWTNRQNGVHSIGSAYAELS